MRLNPCVLIVDDDPDILNFIRIGLQNQGIETMTAATGEESVQCARKCRPDLVLMDIELPGISGLDACWQIKQAVPTFIPIILVTVKGDIETKIKGTNHGADDFLTKPFVLEELFTKVRAMLRIKKRHDDLEKTCITDELTGIYNRRYFEARLQEECARSRRTRNPLTCAMLDIDHFKKINDNFGHAAGDMALKHLTKLVRSLIRKTDIFARMGGEEFILILPETPLSPGQQMAEIVRAAVASNPLHWNRQVIEMTCSLGVCPFPTNFNYHAKQLIENVDAALYHAKKNGRNRVQVYTMMELDNPTTRFLSSNT